MTGCAAYGGRVMRGDYWISGKVSDGTVTAVRTVSRWRYPSCWRAAVILLVGATVSSLPAGASSQGPLGLPAPPVPKDNRQTDAKIALGKKLFHDARLSADGSVSCATCHKPEKAFNDGLPVAEGIGKLKGTRNTPSLLNAAFLDTLFWDGRRSSLEEQALDPFVNTREHGFENHDAILRVLRQDVEYRAAFQRVFGVKPKQLTMQHVTKAIASFERSLTAGDSPFDRYYYGKDKGALTPEAIRGLALFQGRARCVVCHQIGPKSALFTDNRFHSLGVGREAISGRLADVTKEVFHTPRSGIDRLVSDRRDVAALGRFVVTKAPRDIGQFRTPSLRNVEQTAPYMHDGSLATLEEAVERELYYRAIESNSLILLTPQEKADLVSFLKSLNGGL